MNANLQPWPMAMRVACHKCDGSGVQKLPIGAFGTHERVECDNCDGDGWFWTASTSPYTK